MPAAAPGAGTGKMVDIPAATVVLAAVTEALEAATEVPAAAASTEF